MILSINSKNFISEFINPVSELVSDGRTPIFINDLSELYSISSSKNNAVRLYNIYRQIKISDPINRFNINIDTLKKALLCIKQDFIDFTVDKEALKYADDFIKLNIRLLDDSTIGLAVFNLNVFKALSIDFSTTITSDILMDLKRAKDFASETSKFYLQKEGENIYLYFGDRLKSHTSNIRVKISDKFTGNISESIYDTEILSHALNTKQEILLKYSNVGALILEINQEHSTLNYITTQIKK